MHKKKAAGFPSHTDALVTRALGRATREAILRHKKMGCPICVWRNGKVVWIPPEKIRLSKPHTKKNGKLKRAG